MRTSLLVIAFAVLIVPAAGAQVMPGAPVISAEEIETFRKKAADGNIVDQLVKQVDVSGHKVALAFLRRVKPETNALVHSHVTEIYQILKGSGTLMTGGSLKNPTANDLARVGAGAGFSGVHEGGETRAVGPGDVVIVPEGTPHRFSVLTGEILYLTYRFDSKK